METPTPQLDHCLFPAFTLRLLRELGDGRSINLIGRREQGASRVLDDLEKAAAGSAVVLRVNMHDHRHSYKTLVDGLWRQAKAGGVVKTNRKAPEDLPALCDAIKTNSAPIWMIFENFHDLLDDPERNERYDCDFFRNELNHLRNRPELVLFVQTNRPHDE